MAVENFDPLLIAAFRKAGLLDAEPVVIKLSSGSEAIQLRQRLNNLRRDMRAAKHHLVPVIQGVQVCIDFAPEAELDWDKRKELPAAVVLRPPDQKYLAAIREAGVTLDDVEDYETYASTPEETSPLPSSDSAGQAALNEMFKEKEGEEE